MDSYIQAVAVHERQLAYLHLSSLCNNWRRLYWQPNQDPVVQQEHAARVARAKAKNDLLTVSYLEEYGAYSLIP